MKTITLMLFMLFFTLEGFAQNEEATIKEVLTRETNAFFKHDFKASYNEWHVIPQSVGIVSSQDGHVLNLTDNELNEAYTTQKLNAIVFPDTFERSDWKFRINPTSAFVTFNQKVWKGNKITGQTLESRYMEKISGSWKIISMTVTEYQQ